ARWEKPMGKKPLNELRSGLKATLERKVEFRWTIAAYDRRLPPVLSTPAMIGWMEGAAAEILKPYLPKGSISVGTHINVSHCAPVGVGARVNFTAELTGMEGGRYRFRVAAHAGNTVLGEGSVERALVNLASFSARFERRRRKEGGS
ncbi:MAG: thioesterase family protein, partial [Terriglobia bacterium]